MERSINQAYLDTKDTIKLFIARGTNEKINAPFYLVNQATGEQIELMIKEVTELEDSIQYSLGIHGFITFSASYKLRDHDALNLPLLLGKVVQTEWFDQQFNAPTAKLGMRYEKEQTTFSIWSPTATQVSVIIYGENGQKHDMKLTLNGVWEITILGDLDGACYRYSLMQNHQEREAIDPYGIASTENGAYSVVLDLAKTPEVSQLCPKLKQATDAIIYEVSVRDFTIHETAPTHHKGQYLGLAQLDYLKELGVTHIQLLPIYDFEGVDELAPTESYNWGYNPSQYNVPEGSYATNPRDPYGRINELKTLINALHEKGLGVVMDVVYNHVYDTKTFPFNTIVPGYYYRYDEAGNQTCGSGCGNDVASERRMVRKFIVDSVKFWLETYGIDGFRFDLMGLLDVETMNEVRKACDTVDPTILLYGEGWNMPTGIPEKERATLYNADQLPRISHFNDTFRDTIKGSTFNHQEKGLVLGNLNLLERGKQVLAGSSGREVGEHFKFFDPVQSINYVECHDNHTFWDRIKISNFEETDEVLQKRQLLATAMTIFAQGIPFLHGGQEFFRTKKGVENSYQACDEINGINWKEAQKHHWATTLVKGYLEIRKAHGAFRFPTSSLVKKHLQLTDHSGVVIEYALKNVATYGAYTEIYVFFNLGDNPYTLPTSFEGFHVIADAQNSGLLPLRALGGELVLTPLSTTVIVKY